MKKIRTSLLLVAYPLFLASGLWIYQKISENAAKTFRVPFPELILGNLCFMVTLGLFAYCFLVRETTYFTFTAFLGIGLLLVFLCLGTVYVLSPSLHGVLSPGTHIFEAALVLYGVLLVKGRRK